MEVKGLNLGQSDSRAELLTSFILSISPNMWSEEGDENSSNG